MRMMILSALLAGGLPMVAAAQQAAAPQTAPAAQDANARLRALYEGEWAWRQQSYARVKDERGRWSDNGPTLSKEDPATQAARLAYWENVLRQLDQIPQDRLNADERVNYAVFRQVVETLASDQRYRTYEAPFNSDTFFWGDIAPRAGQLRTAAEYRAYISRLRDLPRYMDENIANMRAGLKRGFTVPKAAATGRDETIVPFTKDDPANPLLKAFSAMPETMSAADRAAIKAEGEMVARTVAIPAYAKLLGFMRTDYLPKARTTLAAEALPDGRAFYQAQIRGFTTTTMTAEEIHKLGLSEVARIGAEMEALKAQTGFKGSMAEFLTFLRTDPQFYAKTPGELLGFASYAVKRMDGKLGQTIGFLPRRRFTIRPVPPEIAPIYTSGRGGLESCLFNTFDLPSRPLYQTTALALHECNPGHSFQAAIAEEAVGRPEFRRQTYFSGYGEGWALYTEWLGSKIGMYDTPYEEFGRLSYEMWRAARLVIDTGIHHYGWSRDQSIQYLTDHTALTNREIVNEIDRYISWPGQALAYKLGELTIRRKRAEAEAKLGDRFDQRAFHDAILAMGSVPLPVLEARLDKFIADGGKNPPGWNPALPEKVQAEE